MSGPSSVKTWTCNNVHDGRRLRETLALDPTLENGILRVHLGPSAFVENAADHYTCILKIPTRPLVPGLDQICLRAARHSESPG